MVTAAAAAAAAGTPNACQSSGASWSCPRGAAAGSGKAMHTGLPQGRALQGKRGDREERE